MKALAPSELPPSAREDEIAFLMIAFECGVRLPLVPFVRQLLGELPLYPLQVSLILWENLLPLCILWHKTHEWDPSVAKL